MKAWPAGSIGICISAFFGRSVHASLLDMPDHLLGMNPLSYRTSWPWALSASRSETMAVERARALWTNAKASA